jgi:hypothetical protein
MENKTPFVLAREYLNYLVWNHKYYSGYLSGYETFYDIIENHYDGNIDDAINNFFLCQFNNYHYLFHNWVECQYQLDEQIIKDASLILKEIMIDDFIIDDFKELVALGEIYIK